LAYDLGGIADCGAVGMESNRPNSSPSRQNRYSDTPATFSFRRQSVSLNFLLRNPGSNSSMSSVALYQALLTMRAVFAMDGCPGQGILFPLFFDGNILRF